MQKECNCNACSGVIPELDQEHTNEPTQKETKPIYDQVNNLARVLYVLGYDSNTVIGGWLMEIMRQIDSLDDDILAIQNEVLTNPKEYTQVRLGELSKKLY